MQILVHLPENLWEKITNASTRKVCLRTRMSSQNSNTLEPGSLTRQLCFACKLMNDSNVFGKQGYNDWKHASNKILLLEKNALHREAVIQLLRRSDAGCRVDLELVKQANAERDYCRAVLQRIVKTIRYLSERGLPFRGSKKIIGSPRKGNDLGTLKSRWVFQGKTQS